MAKRSEPYHVSDPSPVPDKSDWDGDALLAAEASDSPARALSPDVVENLPGNWHLQIGRFKARHGLAGMDVPGAGHLQSALTHLPPALEDLHECVQMLERMHAELNAAHSQGRKLEQQLFEARAALAMMQNQMTGMRSSERRARYQARHDGLTMLPNRSFFHERLEEALARAARDRQTLAVLYLDLDGFKQINDLYGHDTGDELLRVVGARLARAVRSTDMVSRLGGDEFGCLLAGLPPDRQQLERIVGKLHTAVAATFRIGKRSLAVRPSIGIAMYPDDGRTSSMLLSRADAAMYGAKAARSGHQFFDPEIHGTPAAG